MLGLALGSMEATVLSFHSSSGLKFLLSVTHLCHPKPSEQLDVHGRPFWKANEGREQRTHWAGVFVNLSSMNFVLGRDGGTEVWPKGYREDSTGTLDSCPTTF